MPHFEKILFPIDFSERSQSAAPYVLSLARRYHSAVILFHAIEPLPPLYAGMNTVYPESVDYTDLAASVSARLREFAACELPKTDVRCEVIVSDPARAITASAEANQVNLIAMPTHGYGVFRRALLGSITAKVLHDSVIPVWTSAHAPEPSHRAHPQPRRILCAVDLRPQSRRALDFAIELAGDAGAKVELLHVAPEGTVDTTEADLRLQEMAAELANKRIVEVASTPPADIQTSLAGGSIAAMLREMALRKRVDLVVIGRGCIQSNGPNRLKANAYAIIRESPCPVISV